MTVAEVIPVAYFAPKIGLVVIAEGSRLVAKGFVGDRSGRWVSFFGLYVFDKGKMFSDVGWSESGHAAVMEDDVEFVPLGMGSWSTWYIDVWAWRITEEDGFEFNVGFVTWKPGTDWINEA